MIADISAAVAKQGPLRIDVVRYSDPTVTLVGEDWAMAITCPWRWMRGSAVVIAWDDQDVGDEIRELVGTAIVDVRKRPGDNRCDPVLLLTSGDRLEIEADSDLDPWVLLLSDQTFVGSISWPPA